MINLKASTLATLFPFGFCLLLGQGCFAADDFDVSIQTDTSATASIDGGDTTTKHDSTTSTASVVGKESSECEPYGRASSATAAASVHRDEISSNNIRYTLAVSGMSKGGHFRTCSSCGALGFKGCVGSHGNDTHASSFAHASATVQVAFAQATLPGPYVLSIGPSAQALPVGATFAVSGPTGSIPVPQGANEVKIRATPGAIFTVQSSLDLPTTNKGGCCEDQKSQSLPIQLSLHPAALAADNDIPFILRGSFASGFHSVGIVELMKDDKTWATHCTATLIGERTALTAAHCVAGRYTAEVDQKHMRLLLGTSVDDPDAKIFSIEKASVPVAKTAGDFNYRIIGNGSSVSTEDDVAVVLLGESPPTNLFPRYALYSGKPTLESLTSGDDKEPLYFVGYGIYDLTTSSDGKLDTSSAGKRRQAIVPIGAIQNQTFSYVANTQGQNVCSGDSGGPALLEYPPSGWMIVGVTAYGATTCLNGRSMRVDVYKAWIDRQFSQ
ncbi:trypsin-like serine protease [bacterium M00.F.Ca.ET.228.01.1.1]|nr:trypsin-like serine protease [bacterium M00.F.Ca.ET.228.01.1.1]TGR99029.1 trypsin-like serine protease [bacterium M00.F.Ca.ET.191.01.1.1]TGU03341.1 trypsin-like serine protease [bacterium M00.F.Ca.ET.155.01.1.1]